MYIISELHSIENYLNFLFDTIYCENDTSVHWNKFFLCHETLFIANKIFNDSINKTTPAKKSTKIFKIGTPNPRITTIMNLLLQKLLSAYSVCATVARLTPLRLM